jgi:dissimilatory sulfite reductase (desulfoviridin) alpha/beta subunit
MVGQDVSQDSTQTLTEAPCPAGAIINSNTITALEPKLTDLTESPSNTSKILPPAFFNRLTGYQLLVREDNETPLEPIQVRKEGPLIWSLTRGDAWPVFVKRHVLSRPTPSKELKTLSRVSRRHGANRVCLSPQGDLDIFFNDRKSLEEAAQELEEVESDLKKIPASVSACRGLLFCPYACMDCFTARENLISAIKEKNFSSSRKLVHISIHGCQAGGGLDCGIPGFTDLRIVGHRQYPPRINQELAAQSPHLKDLISSCPGKALTLSEDSPKILELNPNLCLRCGFCVYYEPSFSFPEPQGGYFSLEVAGRRKTDDMSFVSPWVLLARVTPKATPRVFQEISDLIGLWLHSALPDEILADFMDRTHLHDFFSEKNPPQD